MLMSKSGLSLFGLEVLCLALYFWHQTVSFYMGWERHWLYAQILLLIAFAAFFALGLYKILHSLIQSLSARTDQELRQIFRAFVLALSPLLLLCLVFLQHFVVLQDIRSYLLPVSLAGCAYLMIITVSRLKRAYPQAIVAPEVMNRVNPHRFSARRLAWSVFVVSLAVYVSYASGLIFPAQPFTGDEPHYLLTTKSIATDGDINVYDNYRDKDYLEFYPGELAIHAYPGKKGDEFLYSKHFIGQSVLMLPTYFLGKKVAQWNPRLSGNPELKRRVIVFFARLPNCLFAALLSFVFFFLVLDITQRKDISVLAWAVFSFTSPILFFSHLLYPAIPVALITIFVFKYFVLNKAKHLLIFFLSGIAIGLLPWFGIKFIVLAAILFCISGFVLLSERQTGIFWKKTFLFLFPIALSTGFYLFFLRAIYGNLSPISTYTGVSEGLELSAYHSKFLALRLLKILSRSLGYLIDQKYGLFIYSPIYILGFAGLYFLFKKRKRETVLLLIAMTVYWIFSSNYYWGGYCPPGRPVIPLIWIFGLFLAIVFTEKQSRFRIAVISAGLVLSAGMVWAALRNPWILYQEQYGSELGGEFLYSKLSRALSNSFVQFHNLMPSLRELVVLNWLTLIIWIIVICAIVVIFIKKRGGATRTLLLRMTAHLCFVFLLSLLLFTYVFFDIHLGNKVVFPDQNYELYFQDDNNFGKEVGGFWTKGKRTTSVILKSPEPLSNIEVSLTSSAGGITSMQVGGVRKKVTRTKSTGYSTNVVFSSIRGFPFQQGYLYTITIGDSSGFVPFQLDRNVRDNRFLGVFVRFKIDI